MISGGLDLHVNAVKEAVNADDAVSNILVFDEQGVFQGVRAIVGMNKDQIALEYCKQLGVPPDQCLVIGDSINDITLFKAFKNSLAIYPHESLVEHASVVCDKGSFSDGVKKLLEWLKMKKPVLEST